MKFKGKQHTGTALLETHELIFRGDFRLKIPRSGIREVSVEAGQLLITFDEGVAAFSLGDAASKWADKILHPPTRVDKFGIKNGVTFAAIGAIDAGFLEEIRTAGGLESENAEVILLAAPDKSALGQLPSLSTKTVWIIYPKGVKTITEGDVLTAGRRAGLVDIKVVGFSDSHTALKFVPPRKKG